MTSNEDDLSGAREGEQSKPTICALRLSVVLLLCTYLSPIHVLILKKYSTLQASFFATSDLPFTDIILEHWTLPRYSFLFLKSAQKPYRLPTKSKIARPMVCRIGRLLRVPSIEGANQLYQLSTRSLYSNEVEFYRRSDQRGMSLGHPSSLGDQYDTNSQLSRNNSPQSDTDKSAPPRKRVPVAVCQSLLTGQRVQLTWHCIVRTMQKAQDQVQW